MRRSPCTWRPVRWSVAFDGWLCYLLVIATEFVSVTHERYVLAGALGVALITSLGAVLVAWLQNRKTRRENTEQHANGQQAAQERHEQMLAVLANQDTVRGVQVDGLHTAIGRVDGKLEAHIADVSVHGKKEL